MKDYLILYVFALCFFFSNAIINVRVTKVLTPKVASFGLLILDTSGLNVVLKKEDKQQLGQFPLRVQRLNSNSQINLYCFIYQYKDQLTSRIGCFTRFLDPGTYKLHPFSITVSLKTENSLLTQLRIMQSNIAGTFEVTTGTEFYFYDYQKKTENFEFSGHVEDIEFSLFESFSGSQTIYFNDIPITCKAIQYKLICNLYSYNFPSNRKTQIYSVYIKDSLGNKKYNYFVHPVEITLNYL